MQSILPTLFIALIIVSLVECCQKELKLPRKQPPPRQETPIATEAVETEFSTTATPPTTTTITATTEATKHEPTTPPPPVIDENCLICCDRPDNDPELSFLSSRLSEQLIGQHLATSAVYSTIKGHLMTKHPQKALLLSFHGSSGTGKTHTARIIAQSLFKKGLESKFVHTFVGRQNAESDLASAVKSAVVRCARSLFILEVDLLTPDDLDTILPLVEYNDIVDGVDFRKAIFIFVSNRGGREINDLVIEHRDRGGQRETMRLVDFERAVTNSAFNEKGGLFRSSLVARGLVDVFVPFLPLETTHVEECVRRRLKEIGRQSDKDTVKRIARSLQYFKEIYSSTGCKKVAARTDVELNSDEERDEL